MSALICDICGGNLSMDASGAFAICESCGMKHSKERVKVKVQEIQGTVKIDGAVETVKGDAEKERLLKNAETFLQLDQVKKAKEIYLQLKNDYPNDYRGWLGALNYFCIYGIPKNKFYDKSFSREDDLFNIVCENASVIIKITKEKNIIETAVRYLNSLFVRLIKNNTQYYVNIFKNGFDMLGDYQIYFKKQHEEVLKYDRMRGDFENLKQNIKYLVFKSIWPSNHIDKPHPDNSLYCDFVFRDLVGLSMGIPYCDYNPEACVKLNQPLEEIINEYGLKIINARKASNLCQHCGGAFKGVFSKVCTNCGRPKDY